jgi:hypothetical protein
LRRENAFGDRGPPWAIEKKGGIPVYESGSLLKAIDSYNLVSQTSEMRVLALPSRLKYWCGEPGATSRQTARDTLYKSLTLVK